MAIGQPGVRFHCCYLTTGQPPGRARKHRIHYEGAIDHIRSRGDCRREPIFMEAQDRTVFLEILGAS